MYKKLITLIAVLSPIAAANASTIICPATVKAGTQLRVTAKITNEDCTNPMIINKTVVSLMGNTGSGTVGLQGPFVKPLANNFTTLIPHANCTFTPYSPNNPQFGGFQKTIPTSHTFSNLVVIAQVPVGMGGTLATVTAGVLDTNNVITIAGMCITTVIK